MNIFSRFFCFLLVTLSFSICDASDPASGSVKVADGLSLSALSLDVPATTAARRGGFFMAPEDGSMELGSGFKRPQLDTELSAESFAGDLSSPLGAGFTKTLTMFSPLSSENVILAADDVSTSFTHIRRHFKGYEIIEAANGDEAVEKAREAAMAGTPIKLFLMDFRMPRRNGGQASVAIRDIEVKGKKPYENSIFICLSATPEDAAPYQIKDLDGSLSGRERDPLEVFHQVRGKIEKPKDAKDVLEFTNRLLVRAFTFAGEAMDSLVK